MAGRKPKPTAVKKLEGNPGKRSNVITIRHVVSVYCLMCYVSASCISPSSVASPSLPSTFTSSGSSTQEQYPGSGW